MLSKSGEWGDWVDPHPELLGHHCRPGLQQVLHRGHPVTMSLPACACMMSPGLPLIQRCWADIVCAKYVHGKFERWDD